MHIITKNKKAFFDYEVLKTFEAGLVLTGDEVKSLRAGKVSLVGAFAIVRGGEVLLINCLIPAYAQAYQRDKKKETRPRKLLLHRREIERLVGEVSRKGMSLIPLKLYFNERNVAKVEIGLCRHKKAAGKKQALKERDIERQTKRELKDATRG